jgi:HTH-type transcriptional regulator / antitoxin HigA
MTDMKTEYIADIPSHPGETLLETLELKGMTQAELAVRTGRPKKTINEIIKGKVAITPETALQLELALDIPATFWNSRERHYQEAIARLEQKEKLEEWLGWLEEIPYQELIAKKWLPNQSDSIETLKQILKFFGVVSPEQWKMLWSERLNVAFRKSTAYSQSDFAIAAWLRKAELLASEVDCEQYNETDFRQALSRIKDLTTENPSPELYQDKIAEICRGAGVAFITLPKLSQGRVFGASQWLSPRKAMIVISLYFKTDDIFWFTLFHEAAHLLLHSKKDTYIDLDDNESYSTSGIEFEANQFARDLLIPNQALREFVNTRKFTKQGEPYIGPEAVCELADKLGIAPSIVVGRLQHDGILDHKYNNKLKTTIEWTEDEKIRIKKLATDCSEI